MDNGMRKTRTDTEAAITNEDVQGFETLLREYQQGKQVIDQKATANWEWWRMRHWEQMGSKDAGDEENATSAWLFNSIINKHADIMDNFPKPNVLPREQQDEAEAKALSQILPVISERNDYEQVYSDKSLDLLVDGGCVTSVLWDNTLNNGLGDISIKRVDVHNIFWQPGIEDIQESEAVFVSRLVDNDKLAAMYPQMKGKEGGGRTTQEYVNRDEQADEQKKSEVWDMYYKTTVQEEVASDPRTGDAVKRPRTVLHFVKFCNGELLYASENDPGMEGGWYQHGQYPFVVASLFQIKDSPWGFGYVDVMKSPQAQIDKLDQMILKNASMVGTKRWAVRENAEINADDFADWGKVMVRVSGSAPLDDIMKEISASPIPAFVVQHKANMIEQLKETSGNRDVSQGSAQGGVTAATAIAALQEAGSKLSRSVNRTLYRAKRQEDYLQVELIRQFYTEPRSFRIDNEDGSWDFIEYGGDAAMRRREARGAVFDIQITAEKQSPFSRAAQNETMKEMYGLGLFAPNNAESALVCIEGMEFEGKEKIKQQIQQNSVFMQQFQAMQQAIMSAETQYPGLGIAAMAGLAPMPAPDSGRAMQAEEGTPEERAAKTETDSTRTAKARVSAAKQARIG